MSLTQKQLEKARRHYSHHREEKKEQSRQYRQDHPDKIKAYGSQPDRRAKQREAQAKFRKKNRDLIAPVLLHYGCRNPQCGSKVSGHIVEELQFHHLDPTQKEECVRRMFSKGKCALAAEINKCAVLCANCHIRLHLGLFEVSEVDLCKVNDNLQIQQ